MSALLGRGGGGENTGSDGGMTDTFYFMAASRSSLTRSLRLAVKSQSDSGDYGEISSSSAVRLDVQKSSANTSQDGKRTDTRDSPLPHTHTHTPRLANPSLRRRSAGLALICQI